MCSPCFDKKTTFRKNLDNENFIYGLKSFEKFDVKICKITFRHENTLN